MTTNYLDLDFSNATMFQYSKSAKENYEAHTSASGKESYRRYFNKGIYGVFKGVETKDSPIGRRVILVFENQNELFKLNFGMFDEKGNFDNRYAEPLICTLPNMNIGDEYRVYPWRMDPSADNDITRTFYGVSIKTASIEKEEVYDKIDRAFKNPKRDEVAGPNHLPKLEFREKQGKNRPTAVSVEAKFDAIDDILTTQLERFGASKPATNPPANSTKPASTKDLPKPTANADMPKVDVDSIDDDLPF